MDKGITIEDAAARFIRSLERWQRKQPDYWADPAQDRALVADLEAELGFWLETRKLSITAPTLTAEVLKQLRNHDMATLDEPVDSPKAGARKAEVAATLRAVLVKA